MKFLRYFLLFIIITIATVISINSLSFPVNAENCSCNRDCSNDNNNNPPEKWCSRDSCGGNNNGQCQQCRDVGRQSDCHNNQTCRNNGNGKNICVDNPPTPPPVTPPPTSVCTSGDLYQVTFIVDKSNSMKDELPIVKSALHGFVDEFMKGNKRTALGLATFNWNTNTNATMNALPGYWENEGDITDYMRVRNGIDGIRITNNQLNGSCMECSLLDAEDYINDPELNLTNDWVTPRRPYKKVIVVMSDGMINRWVGGDGNIRGGNLTKDDNSDDIKQGQQQAMGVVNRLKAQGVVFHSISYGTKDVGNNFMKDIVSPATGGIYYAAPNFAGIDAVLKQLAKRILGGNITGTVYYDSDNSRTINAGDPVQPNEYVELFDTSRRWISGDLTDTQGKYTFDGGLCGNYIVKAYVYSPIQVTVPSSGEYTVNVPASGLDVPNINFAFYRPVITSGGISGTVFFDNDGDGYRDLPADTAYTGSVTFQTTIPNNATRTFLPGSFNFPAIPITSPSSGYTMSLNVPPNYEPTTATGVTFRLYASGGCSSSLPGTTCANAVLSNANIGISDSVPWIQTTGSVQDAKTSGFTNTIAPPATNQCQEYMVRNATGSINPGIVHTGVSNPYFGSGSPSSKGWLVAGETDTTSLEKLPTAFESMTDTLEQNKIVPLDFTCDSGVCAITDTIQSSPYLISEDMDLGAVSITDSTKKVVVLVDGNLYINAPIKVVSGAFLMFVVSGDIHVDPSVGGTTRFCAGTATDPQIQAVLSSDKNVFIDQDATCPNADRQLNVAGNIITNADRSGNERFVNLRSLCSGTTGNKYYPAFTIQPRLDFLLNAPTYMLRKNSSWQEVAP